MASSYARSLNVRMVQNFHLVWLDESIDEMNGVDCRDSIIKLRQLVNTVNTFTNVDECIDFINGIKEEKTFLISSGALSQTIVPAVHDRPQVNTIYIFGENKTRYEEWIKQWPKVEGVFRDIAPICKALKQTVHDCDHNSISISFIQKFDGSSNQDLSTLDKSFMYTQMLKEILCTVDFQQSHINDFLSYCHTELAGNTFELKNVGKLRKEYHDHQPIWWYTYECFLYSMLNRTLRVMEVDRIIKMGFFIHDLHNHIDTLHAEQFDGQNHSDSFILYRGQGLSQTDFDQLNNTQGGLLVFNNFLSTSKDHNVSLNFAQRTVATSDLIGVLFIINIDPSISATPFANVTAVSFYEAAEEEEETLFSMQSVFRIGQVQQLKGSNRLYQVNLTLTGDNDPQLYALTKSIQEETLSVYRGWPQLGMLMIKLGEFDKAEELYNILFEQTNDKGTKAFLYHQLGWIMDDQGKYAEAVQYYEKALEIWQKTLPANHPDLATSYNNIGLVYANMGEYSKALSSHEKALEIRRKILPKNHPDLPQSYNNIGLVYGNMREYSTALSYFERTLEIYQKTLPANHPLLATSYNNIGSIYDNMGEYSKALLYYEQDLEISQKNLSANDPLLATSYNNIGSVYDARGEYSKALSYYDKALEMKQKTLPENHPSLVTSYNNMGLLYYNMREYSKAFSYYEKVLEIRQKTLPEKHPDLATSYNNIGLLYRNKGDYSKALSYYERALDIAQRSLPANHPHLQSVKENIEIVKKKL